MSQSPGLALSHSHTAAQEGSAQGWGVSSLPGERRMELAQPRGCPKSLEGYHSGSLLRQVLLGAQQGAGWAQAGWATGAPGAVGEEMLRAGSSTADMAVGLSYRY